MTETGIVFKAISGFYYIEAHGETIECTARGRFRHDNVSPLVGDSVEYTVTQEGKGVISGLLPRRNCFVRPPIANLDQMVIIASACVPVTDPYLVDRMTVIARANNCDCIICLNKSDVTHADELYDIYSRTGYRTIHTSAKTGEGIEQLREELNGRVSAFTGNSGVGKSSILNALDKDAGIPVGDVSQKLGRGRHTTRHVELFSIGDAVIADTPGFSAFDTEKMPLVKKEDVASMFLEFEPHLGGCRFTNCAHVKEIGCSILDALAEGKISKSRHDSYVRLYDLAKKHHDWENQK